MPVSQPAQPGISPTFVPGVIEVPSQDVFDMDTAAEADSDAYESGSEMVEA